MLGWVGRTARVDVIEGEGNILVDVIEKDGEGNIFVDVIDGNCLANISEDVIGGEKEGNILLDATDDDVEIISVDVIDSG